jgi:hypothetical protein
MTGISKNPEFAQMQGVEKILQRHIFFNMVAINFLRASATRLACLPLCRNTADGMKYDFLAVPGNRIHFS